MLASTDANVNGWVRFKLVNNVFGTSKAIEGLLFDKLIDPDNAT